MADFPFRLPKPPNPQALHVKNSPGIHNKLPIVWLGDRTKLVPKQNSRRLLHRIVVLLVQAETSRFLAIPFTAHTPPLLRSNHWIFPNVNTPAYQYSASGKLNNFLLNLLVIIERDNVRFLIPEYTSAIVVQIVRSQTIVDFCNVKSLELTLFLFGGKSEAVCVWVSKYTQCTTQNTTFKTTTNNT